jgi:predicted MarR family transcription regulator
MKPKENATRTPDAPEDPLNPKKPSPPDEPNWKEGNAQEEGEVVVQPSTGPRILSSQHLASPKSPELSEMEYGMIVAWHAFSRWMVRCMSAAGVKDMAPVDVLVLHHINHRGTEKRVGDVGFVLNIEDAHIVAYSVKKLTAMGLLRSIKRGKEVFYSTNAAGKALCERYRQVREACLMPGYSGSREENATLGLIARVLRTASGRYDQAARAASSF